MEFSGLQGRSTNFIGGVELLRLLNVLLLLVCCCCCVDSKSRAIQITNEVNIVAVWGSGLACDSKGICEHLI